MDDKREYNDILIGESTNSNQSKKLLLLIAGIVVLVLAITFVIVSMLSSKQEQEEVAVNTRGIEDVGTNVPEVGASTNKEDDFDAIIKEIRAQQPQTDDTLLQTPKSEPVIQQPKAVMPPKPSGQVTSKPVVITSTSSENINENRRNNGDIATSGYYLQVGAFSKAPNRNFINKLDKYSYRTQEIMINSKVIVRYLIGPYNSRAAAQKDYDSVARNITTPVYLQVQ